MSISKKIGKRIKKSKKENSVEKAINTFATTFIDELKKHHLDELEVFETYTQSVQSRIYKNKRTFCKRLNHGYAVLKNIMERTV